MKEQPVGLIVEGAARESRVLALKKLADEVGPIKSATFPVARRMANTLRAGYAVRDYKELQPANLVFIIASDSLVPGIVEDLIKSTLDVSKLAFLVCESWLTVDVLAPLKEKGACVGTLVEVPSLGRDCFVVDGDFTTAKRVRNLLRNDLRIFEIHPDSKHLLFAAQLLSTTIQLDLFRTAHRVLKASGLSAKNALTLTNQMGQKLLRNANKQISSKQHRQSLERPCESQAALIGKLTEHDSPLAELILTHLTRMHALETRMRN